MEQDTYNNYEKCGKRFRVQDWKVGRERELCFKCNVGEMFKEKFEEKMAELSPRERDIISRRFGFKDGIAHTLEEVGKEFGVTRARIRQVEAKALEKVKEINERIPQI